MLLICCTIWRTMINDLFHPRETPIRKVMEFLLQLCTQVHYQLGISNRMLRLRHTAPLNLLFQSIHIISSNVFCNNSTIPRKFKIGHIHNYTEAIGNYVVCCLLLMNIIQQLKWIRSEIKSVKWINRYSFRLQLSLICCFPKNKKA